MNFNYQPKLLIMQMYVSKNADGTQLVSSTLNGSENTIGVWKLKSFKYDFVYSIVSKCEYKGNPSLEQIHKRNQAYLYTWALNNMLRKKRIKVVKDELYKLIIKHIQSSSNFNEYVTIPSILKHFQNSSTPIQKQVLLDMVKDDLLSKSYHKVKIKKKGFEYLD
jgi:hypothetical protein